MTTLTGTVLAFPLPKLRLEHLALPLALTCTGAMGGLRGCPLMHASPQVLSWKSPDSSGSVDLMTVVLYCGRLAVLKTELDSEGQDQPRSVACALSCISLFTFLQYLYFGKNLILHSLYIVPTR